MSGLEIELARHDLAERADAWHALHDDERRRRAVQAARDHDADALWSLTEWYLVFSGAAGAHVSPHTLRSYKLGVKQFVGYAREHAIGLTSARPSDARAYVLTLAGSGKSPATINARLAAAGALYAALHAAHATTATPFASVVRPKDREHPLDKVPPYDPEVIAEVTRRLREAIDAPDDSKHAARKKRALRQTLTLFVLLAHAGLRIDEALQLRREDVRLDERGGPVLRVRSGKGRKPRVVPLSPALERVLRDELASPTPRRPEHVFSFGHRTTAIEHLEPHFPVVNGRSTFRGFHGVRKYVGSRLYRSIGDFKAVADMLGHASVDTTSAYVRVGLERAKRAVSDWEE